MCSIQKKVGLILDVNILEESQTYTLLMKIDYSSTKPFGKIIKGGYWTNSKKIIIQVFWA